MLQGYFDLLALAVAQHIESDGVAGAGGIGQIGDQVVGAGDGYSVDGGYDVAPDGVFLPVGGGVG